MNKITILEDSEGSETDELEVHNYNTNSKLSERMRMKMKMRRSIFFLALVLSHLGYSNT